mmetsp:Transcript_22094/g.67065  ORF Transcript_22094/g.67065 Transcript_22094/m.67065 type:complete len:238 (+) Transcript_22094:2344-3057(+)
MVRMDIKVVDPGVEGVVGQSGTHACRVVCLQPASPRAELILELQVAVAACVHLVPDDDRQIAHAWKVWRPRDTDAHIAIAIEGGPATSRLVDASVLVCVSGANVAAALRGESTDAEIEGNVVWLVVVAPDRAACTIRVGPPALRITSALTAVGVLCAVVRTSLTIQKDPAVGSLRENVRFEGAALGARRRPMRRIPQSDGFSWCPVKVSVKPAASGHVARVVALFVMVVEAGGLIRD